MISWLGFRLESGGTMGFCGPAGGAGAGAGGAGAGAGAGAGTGAGGGSARRAL